MDRRRPSDSLQFGERALLRDDPDTRPDTDLDHEGDDLHRPRAGRTAEVEEMDTASDPRAPITIFTFFLELSRALPVQSGSMHVSYVDRDDHWQGWSDADVATLLGDIGGCGSGGLHCAYGNDRAALGRG